MTPLAVPLPDASDPRRFGESISMLAVLAAREPSLVPPSLAISAEAARTLETGDASATEEAWTMLGRPASVIVRTCPLGEQQDGEDAHVAWKSTPVRNARELSTILRQAALGAPGRALLVQAAGAQLVWGVACSEDPREDRVDAIHIDAAGTLSPQPVRYRRPRGRGLWRSQIPPGAATMLPTQALADIQATLLRAEECLDEALALSWRWSPGEGVRIVRVAAQRTPLPWAVHRAAPLHHDTWSRANAGEVLAGPVTPMTWSMIGEPLNAGFAAMYPAKWIRGRRFFALFGGHAYFNFGLVLHLVVDRMGGPTGPMLDVVGGPGDARALGIPDRGIRWTAVLRSLPQIVFQTSAQQRLPHRWLAVRAELIELRAQMAARDATRLDDATIVDEIDNIFTAQRPYVRYLMEAQGAAFSSYALLRYCTGWFLGDPRLANTLVQGVPDIATSQANLALWRIAERAASEPEAASIVRDSTPAHLLDTLDASPAGGWLAEALRAHLAEQGHRGAAELELFEPRWADDPTPLLTSFRGYVLNPGQSSVETLFERQRRARESAQRDVDRRLTAHWAERLLPLRRAIVRHYATLAQRYAPLRENPKFYLLGVSYELRRLLLILGRRLSDRDALVAPSDVFFLDRAELRALVGALSDSDPALAGRLRRRIWRRRRFYDAALQETPEPLIGQVPRPLPEPAAPVQAGPRRLEGLAASTGVAEGVARVILAPHESGRLGAGEILVARFTDPGWTHLFPLAGGLVTEIGGVLSHGALVAREYGLPAVVNVPGASTSIRDGARVRVDGANGTVDLLD
jgi:phosphohistidine swiveling domain-containing protein